MRILLTNDDGIHAEGLAVLERIARTLSDDVWVVAPETDQSGFAHSLSLSEPLRLRKIDDRHYALRGTPTDCVIMGVRKIMPEPPETRPANQPWPTYPMIFRVSSAHEEAGERVYAVSTQEFLGDEDGNVRALRLVDVRMEDGKFVEVEGTEREIPAELVLFAMGFTGPEKEGLVEQLGVDLDERGNVARDASY